MGGWGDGSGGWGSVVLAIHWVCNYCSSVNPGKAGFLTSHNCFWWFYISLLCITLVRAVYFLSETVVLWWLYFIPEQPQKGSPGRFLLIHWIDLPHRTKCYFHINFFFFSDYVHCDHRAKKHVQQEHILPKHVPHASLSIYSVIKCSLVHSCPLSKLHCTDGCIYRPSYPCGGRFMWSSLPLSLPFNNLFLCLIVIMTRKCFSHVWPKSLHLYLNHISLPFDLSWGGKQVVTISPQFLWLLKDRALPIVQISASNKVRFHREK